MRILHTSDWHLGKRFLSKDMILFQDTIIDEIAQIADTRNVDIVLVAGGIFDSEKPSPESIGIFLKAVEKITDGGKRAMVVTLGSTDNVALFNSFSYLSKRYNLAVFASSSSVIEYTVDNSYDVKPIESGRGYIVFENQRGERAAIGAICPKTFDTRSDETLLDALKRNVDAVTRKFSNGSFNIIVGDLRLKMQSDLLVDDDMPSCDIFPFETTYVALGGVHRSEICDIDRNAYYCGSILPYDTDDTKGEKGVIVATINEEGEVKKEVAKLKNSKRFKKLKCTGIDDADTQLYKYDDCLVDLSLSLSQPISVSDNNKLFSEHPNLLQLSLSMSTIKGEKKKKLNKIGMAENDIFKNFVNETAPNTYDSEMAELFAQIMEEVK